MTRPDETDTSNSAMAACARPKGCRHSFRWKSYPRYRDQRRVAARAATVYAVHDAVCRLWCEAWGMVCVCAREHHHGGARSFAILEPRTARCTISWPAAAPPAAVFRAVLLWHCFSAALHFFGKSIKHKAPGASRVFFPREKPVFCVFILVVVIAPVSVSCCR